MRVAVIGTGIAGNSAAYALSQARHVTALQVYEAQPRIGGHSATVDVDYDGKHIAVDTGFIVYNTLNYPNLTALFEHFDVPTKDATMSFSVSIGKGDFEWVGREKDVFSGLFAQRRNIVNPRYLGMLLEIMRFQRNANADRLKGAMANMTLGDYIKKGRYSAYFRDRYIVPMGAAIWSTPPEKMLDFPAENFVSFFENHKLLHWDRPVWRTVKGGSREYVKRLTAPFSDRIRMGDPVTEVKRDAFGVSVTTQSGHHARYDHVIIATHTDDALGFVKDASEAERSILTSVEYRPNTVYLHRDPSLMPKRREAWAAWNFLREGVNQTSDVCISYSMQHLQGIDPACPLFVTLNPPHAPRKELTFQTFSYAHPQFTTDAFNAQKQLAAINGQNRTSYAGAWTGYGFHEDGLSSGMRAAEGLGAYMPWAVPAAAEAQPAE
jgi:uncharacterized protein